MKKKKSTGVVILVITMIIWALYFAWITLCTYSYESIAKPQVREKMHRIITKNLAAIGPEKLEIIKVDSYFKNSIPVSTWILLINTSIASLCYLIAGITILKRYSHAKVLTLWAIAIGCWTIPVMIWDFQVTMAITNNFFQKVSEITKSLSPEFNLDNLTFMKIISRDKLLPTSLIIAILIPVIHAISTIIYLTRPKVKEQFK